LDIYRFFDQKQSIDNYQQTWAIRHFIRYLHLPFILNPNNSDLDKFPGFDIKDFIHLLSSETGLTLENEQFSQLTPRIFNSLDVNKDKLFSWADLDKTELSDYQKILPEIQSASEVLYKEVEKLQIELNENKENEDDEEEEETNEITAED